MKKILLGLVLLSSLAKADVIWTLDTTLREISDINKLSLEVSRDEEYIELSSKLQNSIFTYAKNNNLNFDQANNLFLKEIQKAGGLAGQKAMFSLMTGEESVNVNKCMKVEIKKSINFYNN